MSLINKKRLTLLALLTFLLLIFIAVWCFMIWKIYNSITDYQTLAKDNAQQQSDITNARKLIGTVNEVENYYVGLSKNAIGRDGLVGFIETLEKLGTRSGTTVVLGSINVPEDTSSVGTSTEVIASLDDEIKFTHVGIQISAVGEWGNILRLLKMAENLPYALKVDKVRISKSSSGSTILINSNSSGDALPLRSSSGGSSSSTKKPSVPSKSVELWSVQFELMVLKII